MRLTFTYIVGAFCLVSVGNYLIMMHAFDVVEALPFLRLVLWPVFGFSAMAHVGVEMLYSTPYFIKAVLTDQHTSSFFYHPEQPFLERWFWVSLALMSIALLIDFFSRGPRATARTPSESNR